MALYMYFVCQFLFRVPVLRPMELMVEASPRYRTYLLCFYSDSLVDRDRKKSTMIPSLVMIHHLPEQMDLRGLKKDSSAKF